MEDKLNISIRRATIDDVSEIVRLLADDGLGSRREKYEEPLPESYYQAFREIDADRQNELVVLELDGQIIGTMQLTFIPSLSFQGGKRAQIEGVRVDSRHRNLGLGHKLFEWAIARARAEGCRLVQLTTNIERTDAHRFYHDLGFTASHTGMKIDLQKS
ncbi:MAG: GNAT family N-acetyltransferase [Acidobacteria bacterium]|nr:GNAT family N-acetyltransferase [Acidobacteriota bacterium]